MKHRAASLRQQSYMFIEISPLWRFNDFKMAAVRHPGFSKLEVFVMWPLSACRSASSYKMSLKSDNRLMS